MVHFKVVRASRLLLFAAVVLLAVVLAILAASVLSGNNEPPVSPSANLVDAAMGDGAEASLVFAPSEHEAAAALPFDPENQKIEIEVLTASQAPAARLRVLIYHTHTHEAYEQVSDDPYDALEAWRTTDADHSVVRVGQELADALGRFGFEVVHDATDHEGDQLSTAYTRSLQTLLGYDEPFDLYIDLHRDAYVSGEQISFVGLDGEEMAPLMMLIGNGNGFDEKPYYDQNYAFACALEKRVNGIEPGLCKPVLVKDGRYNQHIGVFSILVEVGHNRNTLRQALNSIAPLAEAIDSLMQTRPDSQLTRMKADYEQALAAVAPAL